MGMMKRTVSLLLVLTLLLGMIPAVSAADAWYSGDCGAEGSNVTWTLNTDGSLVISGSGAMEDYWLHDPNGLVISNAPWFEWEMYITSVRVEKGVTHVGDYAFHGLWWVESVELGPDVRTIGAYAFYGLGNLTAVTIPDNVTGIGEYVFGECIYLTKLELGSGLRTIGENAFYYCGLLEEVRIPDSVKTIGAGAFDSCGGVKSLTIGTGVSTLPTAAFSGMRSLTSVTIPGNVKTIERLAFYDCTALKEVTLSPGVQTIGEKAFSNCAMETIYFPASLGRIESCAFADCEKLSLAIFNGDAPEVAADAFTGCGADFSINYPSPARGWSTPEWNGFPAFPFDPFGALPETWPVSLGAHVITVASSTLGADGKVTPLKGATVQILTQSGTVHTGTTDENGQYAYYNHDGKELRIQAEGYQLLRCIYPMEVGGSRIFLLDPLDPAGAPYFSMLCGMLKTGKVFRDLRTEAVHYQKDDGMYMEPLFEIVAGEDIVIDSVMLVQSPDSADLGSSGRSIELTDYDLYDAAEPFRHIRAEVDRFAPGAFAEQRPIYAAISYRYKGDPNAVLYNSEPVELKLFVDPRPETGTTGETNAINTTPGTMAQGSVSWLGGVVVESLHTLFTEFLQADPSVKSDLVNFQYSVETDSDTGNRNLRFAIGLGSGEQEYTVFGTPTDSEIKGPFQDLRDWVNSKQLRQGKPLDFLNSEVGKELGKEFGKTAVNSISKIEGEVLGYYEVVLDPEDQIVPELGGGRVLANVAGKVTTGKTILISGFPVYFEHLAEVSVATTMDPNLVLSPKPMLTMDLDKLELTIPKLSLEGGVGIRGVATVGVGGVFENLLTVTRKAAEATTSLIGTTNAYFRVFVAFLLDFQKNFGEKGGGKITLYEYPKNKSAGTDQVLTGQSVVQQAMKPQLQLTERTYLQDRSRWTGHPIRLMRDAELSVLRSGVLPNAMPRLHTVGTEQVMLFLEDDGTRELGSHTRLMYSVGRNGVWSEPAAVWDNGSGDLYFDCAVVDGQLVVAWQKLRGGISGSDAQQMLDALAARSEIAVAVWDGTSFTGQQYLTEDDTLDMMASVAGGPDGICVTWVTNDENDLMGTGGSNTIRTVTLRDDALSMPRELYTTDRFLTELTTAVSGGELQAFFGLMNDDGSTELLHFNGSEAVTVAQNGSFAGLSAADGCFLWQSGGTVCRYSPSLAQQETLVSLSSDVSSSYRYLKEGDTEAIVWAEGQEPGRILASIRTGEGWSEPVVLADGISQAVTFLDAALTGDGSFVLAVNTAQLSDEADPRTTLQAGVITPAGDVALTSVAAGRPDPVGDTQELVLTVENQGLLPVSQIRLTITDGDTVLADRTLDVALTPGGEATLTEQVALSGWTGLTVCARIPEDKNPADNSRSISAGHTDTALELDAYEQDDTVILLMTASNASAIPAAAAIRVFRENAEGEGLACVELGTLSRGENLQYVYTLDKGTLDFGGEDSVYYLFRLECANDWDESDNVCAWRVEKPAEAQDPLDVPTEPLEVVRPESVQILSGDQVFPDPDAPERKLQVRITPADASITAVQWRSGDEAVARVLSDGTLIPVGSGSTTITAILTEELTDSITVTVGERPQVHTHTPVLDLGYGSTCTEEGLSDGVHCGECGEVLTAREPVPALDHDWSGTLCRRCGASRSNPFNDVPEDSFCFDPVLWAVEAGITDGTSSTTFSPADSCLRAHVVTFLWRAAGSPEPVGGSNPFTDVQPADFYYKAVLWAVENGITDGLDADHFGPYAYCNRAQVVTFLYRAMHEPALSDPRNPFTDVTEGSFYHLPVLWAVEAGITDGMTATTFGPDSICNRAQIVTFLYRAMA